MNAKQRRQIEAFLSRVQSRIDAERGLARLRGVRRTARAAAARRARDLALDLDYLRETYGTAGQGSAQ